MPRSIPERELSLTLGQDHAEPLFALLTSGQAQSAPRPRIGLTFTVQDYLGLSAHPAVRSAALGALGTHRLIATRVGLTPTVLDLEDRLAAFLQLPVAVTFPSGAEAIRQTFRAILRPDDHVIVDSAAHPAMFEAILLSKAHLHRSPSASVDGVERRLARLARQPQRGRLIIAVPAISAHGSKVADLAELSALARQYQALLVVDVTHDLGAVGPLGRGQAEVQSCLGRIDILLGSLAKTFGAPGGFAAFRDPGLRISLSQTSPHTTGLSPINAAAILAALDIVTAPEGQRRRRNLHSLSLRLRNHLMADGIRPMGKASPFVPILLPALTALPRTALLESAGPRVSLLQAPTVPLHDPRWRIQLTADHSPADIDDLAELIRDVTRAFARSPARTREPA